MPVMIDEVEGTVDPPQQQPEGTAAPASQPKEQDLEALRRQIARAAQREARLRAD
jgi:hypothetical protein